MNADLTACVMFRSLTLLYTCKSECDLAGEKSLLSARPISEKCKRHDVHEAFRVSSRDKRLRQRRGVGMPWGSLEIEAPIPRPHLWQKVVQARRCMLGTYLLQQHRICLSAGVFHLAIWTMVLLTVSFITVCVQVWVFYIIYLHELNEI